jgi:uncharacterized protein (DUF952 family)
MLIFKICHAGEWREAEAAGVYHGTPKDKEDGFLHFSRFEQLDGTLKRYYANETDLLLVAVDDSTLGEKLKNEEARNGELFPHLYAPLPLTAVQWIAPLSKNADGEFETGAIERKNRP